MHQTACSSGESLRDYKKHIRWVNTISVLDLHKLTARRVREIFRLTGLVGYRVGRTMAYIAFCAVLPSPPVNFLCGKVIIPAFGRVQRVGVFCAGQREDRNQGRDDKSAQSQPGLFQ